MQVSLFDKSVEKKIEKEVKKTIVEKPKVKPRIESRTIEPEVFDFKEFTKWWEDYKENKAEFDKKMDETVASARETYTRTQKIIDDWKLGSLEIEDYKRGLGR